jgi:hypothetical protein
MYPRTTHSTGTISSRSTSIPRPRTSSGTSVYETRWLGQISSVSPSQNAVSPVSILPLSGIGVGWTTS